MCSSQVLEEFLCDKLKANSKSVSQCDSIDRSKGDSGFCYLE